MPEEARQPLELSESEMRENLIRLAFEGDPVRLDEFCLALSSELPLNTAAVMRGSSVTGYRWEDGEPFDAKGPGSSDLDLTLVGGDILEWFEPHGFYIAGVHTKPLSDKDHDIAPRLQALRDRLIRMAGRPVNIQGTKDWVMYIREHLMGQPYLRLLGKLFDT
jgi:hypothetical protein